MTRGKIIFIDDMGHSYQTPEFNGDMYPEGHGGTIIEKYVDGGIRSYYDYEKFCVSFDRRYFGYMDFADEFLAVSMIKDDCVDYTNNWTDYLYVINGSGRMIKALTETGSVDIPAADMAIFHYQKLSRLVQIQKRGDTVFPKKKFVEILDRLQEVHDLKNNIDELICGKSDEMRDGFPNGSGMIICHEHSVIELLEFIMNDQGKDIEHFIYELDYGRTCKAEMVTDFYEKDIEFSSAGTLYDHLMKEKEKNKNMAEPLPKIENLEA